MAQVFSIFAATFFFVFLGQTFIYTIFKNVADILKKIAIIISPINDLGDFMRCFSNIAQLIRTKRQQHPKGYSQSELSHLLGYKNGQFISNVERALCNVPLKMLGRVSEVLDIPAQELKVAILKDHEETLNNYLKLESQDELKAMREKSTEKVSTSTNFSGQFFKMS